MTGVSLVAYRPQARVLNYSQSTQPLFGKNKADDADQNKFNALLNSFTASMTKALTTGSLGAYNFATHIPIVGKLFKLYTHFQIAMMSEALELGWNEASQNPKLNRQQFLPYLERVNNLRKSIGMKPFVIDPKTHQVTSTDHEDLQNITSIIKALGVFVDPMVAPLVDAVMIAREKLAIETGKAVRQSNSAGDFVMAVPGIILKTVLHTVKDLPGAIMGDLYLLVTKVPGLSKFITSPLHLKSLLNAASDRLADK